jgi:hypothetical protein
MLISKKCPSSRPAVVGRKRAVNFDENAVYEVRKNSYGVSKVQTPGINPDSASSDPRGLTIEAEIVLKDQVFLQVNLIGLTMKSYLRE